jgi:aryl sulfotransferase
MSRAIWLASYPKSGNTWMRLALRSLQAEGSSVDLTDIVQFGHTVTRRSLFDAVLEVDSSDLTQDEVEELRPSMHDLHFDGEGDPQLCKVHDAWFRTGSGRPVFDAAHTHRTIYILRDPRDVAVSWARFSNVSIEGSIAYLANPDASLTSSRKHIDGNIAQRIGSWSGHVTSWIDDSGLSPLVIRYEDMHADLPAVLIRTADHLGWPHSPQAIAGAVAATRFDRLAEQERRFGFAEMPDTAKRFFVSGREGGWRDVLTADQASQIERDHRAVMKRFGYL